MNLWNKIAYVKYNIIASKDYPDKTRDFIITLPETKY